MISFSIQPTTPPPTAATGATTAKRPSLHHHHVHQSPFSSTTFPPLHQSHHHHCHRIHAISATLQTTLNPAAHTRPPSSRSPSSGSEASDSSLPKPSSATATPSSPTPAQTLGATFFSDQHDLCEQYPDIILICTSILSTEHVLKSLHVQLLRRNTLFVDVLSVKKFPKTLYLLALPLHFDILCTHPMFGPESLPFVFDKVRIRDEESRVSRVKAFLEIFRAEGCRMVEMSCAEHDKDSAPSQFIMHTIGRMLEKLDLKSTPINTKGYESLLEMVENAMEQLERLSLALEELKKELFGKSEEGE